jgi:protein disulfide-isomerase A6
MFLPALLLTARCDYVEITKANLAQTIGGRSPILVKFYSETCGHCLGMAEDFAEAAKAFGQNVTFGGVECKAQDNVCKSYKVTQYPTIKLFLAGDRIGIDFSGPRTVDGFCSFVENYTDFRAIRPPSYTVDLHPLNFNETVNSTRCLFVTFYAPWCGHCKHFLPQFRLAAKAFIPDKVVFGLVNCAQYAELCKGYAEGFPTIRLFANGTLHEYKSARTVQAQAVFINSHCGTQRGGDGLLTEAAGLIEEASAVVQELINASDPAPYVERLRAINGAEFYVKAAERYIAKGADQLTKDMVTIAKHLADQSGSWSVLDNLKRRFNTFGEFFPKLMVPKDTPAPAEAVNENGPAEAVNENAPAPDVNPSPQKGKEL